MDDASETCFVVSALLITGGGEREDCGRPAPPAASAAQANPGATTSSALSIATSVQTAAKPIPERAGAWAVLTLANELPRVVGLGLRDV